MIIPYISLGARFSSNSSWLNYELYADDSCYCFDTQADEFTTTNVLGLTTGLGIKIQPFERFYIDLRVTYHGGWGLTSYAKNPHLPNTDSFHIDAYGQPTMSFSNKRWAQGMNFSVGLVYGFQSTSGSGWSFSDGDDDDEDYDSEDDYDSDDDGSSGRSCDPIELKPSGRGGG